MRETERQRQRERESTRATEEKEGAELRMLYIHIIYKVPASISSKAHSSKAHPHSIAYVIHIAYVSIRISNVPASISSKARSNLQ